MSDVVKKRKSIFKRWWFWVIIVFVIIIYGASQGDSDDPKVAEPSSASSKADSKAAAAPVETKSAEPSKEPEKTEFKIGERVQLKDNILTVNKVEKTKGTEFDSAKEGHEYVIVTLTIENGGKDNIDYNPFDFKMSNSQGQITDKAFTIVDSDTTLNSGELAPGGKVTGTIAFEQPAGDKKLQLQFKPSFWSNKTIKVNLQ